MTPDELKGAFKAMGISNGVAWGLGWYTFLGTAVAVMIAGRNSADPSVDFRWEEFWTIMIAVVLPLALVTLNSVILGFRYAIGRHPERRRLTKAEKRAVKKALAEARSAQMEKETAGIGIDSYPSDL